jgi:hypothetical protein
MPVEKIITKKILAENPLFSPRVYSMYVSMENIGDGDRAPIDDYFPEVSSIKGVDIWESYNTNPNPYPFVGGTQKNFEIALIENDPSSKKIGSHIIHCRDCETKDKLLEFNIDSEIIDVRKKVTFNGIGTHKGRNLGASLTIT